MLLKGENQNKLWKLSSDHFLTVNSNYGEKISVAMSSIQIELKTRVNNKDCLK